MAKGSLKHISISTKPNGYLLQVGNNEYFAFNAEKLLTQFVYHVGMTEAKAIKESEAQEIINFCKSWGDNADVMKQALRLTAQVKQLKGSLAALSRHCTLLERKVEAYEK